MALSQCARIIVNFDLWGAFVSNCDMEGREMRERKHNADQMNSSHSKFWVGLTEAAHHPWPDVCNRTKNCIFYSLGSKYRCTEIKL